MMTPPPDKPDAGDHACGDLRQVRSAQSKFGNDGKRGCAHGDQGVGLPSSALLRSGRVRQYTGAI